MRWLACRIPSILLLATLPLFSQSQPGSKKSSPASIEQEAQFHVGPILYEDDFRNGLGNWVAEMQKPGSVSADNGVLDIDVPAGLTLWFRSELHGPVLISYDATVISAGGPNDRVSDLNCFWMATDPSSPRDIFAHQRSGFFPAYDSLQTYYVGVGGHDNTTTRFRRYGQNSRPLRTEDDLRSPDVLLVPNQSQHIRLIADGRFVEFYRDNKRLFNFVDPEPYTEGWFGLRTTRSHLRISNFRIFRLVPTD